MHLPVIRADLTLEETYPASTKLAAVPTFVFVGTRPSRDREASRVDADSAAFWLQATSAAGSKVCELTDCDWYILQEEVGVRAVLREAATFMRALRAAAGRS